MDKELAILESEAISQIVEKSVHKALRKILPSIIRRASLPEYINTSELSRLANWSSGKIQYMRQENRIKYIQEGRSIVYPTDWILNYLESHSISPNDEVLEELFEAEGI